MKFLFCGITRPDSFSGKTFLGCAKLALDVISTFMTEYYFSLFLDAIKGYGSICIRVANLSQSTSVTGMCMNLCINSPI